MATDIKIEDNSKEFIKELDDRVPPALEECGLAAEGYAKRLCPVDTGLLRNSITHAVSGQPPSITSYKSNATHADTKATQKAKTAGKPVIPIKTGSYNGKAPNDNKENPAVYIGTNVEYAEAVELGSSGRVPQPFLKPAVTDHESVYKGIIERWLGKKT